ncbi:ABC transporter ATP-binding protein [Oceanirhabdus sp. W0125-5]|uniref:ABC transporter ATP-binding protein n=1 Tax=Oceanirhabdus sp. W0125-5 TaxID=2999116 RepID=UPI0022F2D7BF|nr:ABC transporter ATP-binding protein [Oceanirhabdus sp. W0125-5]WBW95603.1 ABC transporter ATP-binding protein [Oceanirhabdus sp. W0125-5]
MELLSVKNLTKLYKNNRGIKNLNLTIYEGEVVALLGPNGAGKTTAIKSIIGFSKKTNGEVAITGYSPETDIEKAMLETGVMVGKSAHYEYLSGYKNLKIHSELYRDITEQKILKVLEYVELLAYKDEKVANYSTGMKQRLAFAKALLHEPKLLLIDEPFSGLDIEGRAIMKNILKKMSYENNVGILISSHLINDINDIATKVCIIHHNQWLETRDVEKIFEKYNDLEEYYLDRVKGKVV